MLVHYLMLLKDNKISERFGNIKYKIFDNNLELLLRYNHGKSSH